MKKNFFKVIGLTTINFIIYILLVVLIDPFFHYHLPNRFFSYDLNSIIGNTERLINSGIIRSYNYNGVIIGSSMTEKFSNSQFEQLFKVESIKLPMAGASFYETNKILEKVLQKNKKVKFILRGLDSKFFCENFRKDIDELEYLYDDNYLNDYKYFFNPKTLEITGKILLNTIFRKKSNLNLDYYPSKSNIRKKNGDLFKLLDKVVINKEKKKINYDKLKNNIDKNLIKIAKNNPQTNFLYFIPPYSILYWKELKINNELEKYIEIEKIVIEELLKVKNIKVYSFYNNYDIICEIKNYDDPLHYIGEINDEILNLIALNRNLITLNNYQEYLQSIKEFYLNYNYELLEKNNGSI